MQLRLGGRAGLLLGAHAGPECHLGDLLLEAPLLLLLLGGDPLLFLLGPLLLGGDALLLLLGRNLLGRNLLPFSAAIFSSSSSSALFSVAALFAPSSAATRASCFAFTAVLIAA